MNQQLLILHKQAILICFLKSTMLWKGRPIEVKIEKYSLELFVCFRLAFKNDTGELSTSAQKAKVKAGGE